MEEKTAKEIFLEYQEEFKAKYHEAIVALCNKYGVDLGVGFDMVKAIGLALVVGEAPLYEAEGIDLEALKEDYVKFLALQEAYING